MNPHTASRPSGIGPRKLRALSLLLAGALVAPTLALAQQDAPAVNVAELLKALHTLKEQQTTTLKTQRQAAYQRIISAAGSPEAAAALWEEAIKATQMEGAGKENTQFRNWKEGAEGEAFKEREVQFAVQLHLQWLALTIKRSGGVTVKDLLPEVIRYSQVLLNDENGMEALGDTIKKEKEAGDKNAKKAQKSRDDASMKRVHDQILNRSVASSVVAQWFKLADMLQVNQWEMTPGNYDGIYRSIILPELRLQKDMRIFEYWDAKLKKEGDAALKTKLSFEVDKFNTQRRPILLWNRAQEFVHLGQKNRAVGEMYNLIKAFPLHPDADEWIAKLETLLAPPAPVDPTTTTPGTPGTVPPTTVVPGTGSPTAATPVAPRPGL